MSEKPILTKQDLTTKFNVLPYEIRARIFFSPKYVNLWLRPFWKAELVDGTIIDEIEPDGSERRFKDIDKATLSKVHIFARGGQYVSTPLYSGRYPGRKYDLWLDLKNGVFYADMPDGKVARTLECSDLPLKYNEGIILYKETSIPIHFNPGPLAAPSTPMIDHIGLGYKVNWGGFKYQVVCKIFMDTKTEFEATKTNLITGEKIIMECDPI